MTFFRKIASRVAPYSLWLLTGLILAVASTVYLSAATTTDAANFGNLLAGVASAIALVWLVAGYRMQSHELTLQREEIRLQRLAIEQQAKELSNSARLSSLAQIQEILEQATASVRDSSLGLKNPSEIVNQFMQGMENWKVVLNSHSPAEVQRTYFEWLKIESCARGYVRDVSTAMKLYIEFHRQGAEIDLKKPPEEFVHIYQSWVASAPYISAHMGSACALGQFLFIFRPGLDALQLGGLTASAKLVDTDIVKKEGMEELREKLVKRGTTLPQICEPWPFAA